MEIQLDTLAYLGFDNMIKSPRLSPNKLLRNVGIPFGICWDLKLCAGTRVNAQLGEEGAAVSCPRNPPAGSSRWLTEMVRAPLGSHTASQDNHIP